LQLRATTPGVTLATEFERDALIRGDQLAHRHLRVGDLPEKTHFSVTVTFGNRYGITQF
jgi:hypothetical protein